MEDEQQEQEIPPVEAVEQAYMDDQQDYGEYATENQEDQQFGSYPTAAGRESIFTFFNNILS